MDFGRCNSSLSSRIVCCSNFYLEGGVCKPCPGGTYGVNCSQRCPTGLYGERCGYFCKCPPEQCIAATGCITTSPAASSQMTTETTMTVYAHETSTGSSLKTTDLLDSTVRNGIFSMQEETEPFPYKMIMVGMGAVILCFLVFSLIQICSKVRSKRKRKRVTPSEESGTYHEIPAAGEIAPLEIARHYNEITEHSDGGYKEIQQQKRQQEMQQVGLYRELISDDIKLENIDTLHETISQNMYLTVDNATRDEENASSDDENRESYLEPSSKKEKHLYTDILESSYDVTSDTGTGGDGILSCSDDGRDDSVSTDSAGRSGSVQQNDIYLDVI
ncbi:uncharacterized protein LOC125680953 [Ostrea edulis]|uniref:uncharacterized protein LOC125680953 n=1 Tax=Ostrea edulis TaxID=37623 RepID=UPI0024AF50D6|nr:uncharacterized protein LOC125680953 [Ostrea edulis]